MNDGRPKVQSSGNPDQAELVVVGECSGAEDERTGQSFIGPSGQLLRDELRVCGWPDDRVYFGNVIKCRPKKRDGESEFTDAQLLTIARRCSEYLRVELAQVPSTAVVLGAGNLPLQVFVDRRGILAERGIMHRLSDGRRFFPVVNPSYVLYGHEDRLPKQDGLALLRGDLRRLRRWFGRRAARMVPVSHRFVTTKAQLREAEERLLAAEDLFFDFETPGLHPWSFPCQEVKLIAGGFSPAPGEAWGIALAHPDAPLPLELTWPAVKRIMAGPSRKGALKGQHDLHWGGWFGLEVTNFCGDAMLAATLLADKPYTEIKSNLLRLAADWLWEVEYPWLHVDKSRMAEYPVETVVGIAMTDADWEFRIHRELLKELGKRKVGRDG